MPSTSSLITGIVIKGQGIGKQEFVPTANIRLTSGVLPEQHGVYICQVVCDGKNYFGITNIGTRPTVTTSQEVVLEVHIFDLQGSWYGKEVTVNLLYFIRAEQKFATFDALRTQITKDILNARRWLIENLQL